MKKISKNYIATKYRDKKEVDIEDVRLLIDVYQRKIKRLKFLLNDYKKKSEERYWKLMHNAWCSESFTMRFIECFKNKLEELDESGWKELEDYIKEHSVDKR